MIRPVRAFVGRVVEPQDWRGRAVHYFVLGFLLGWVALAWRVARLDNGLPFIGGLVGAVLGVTRLRGLVWAVAAAQVGLLLVMGWTSAGVRLAAGLHRADPSGDAPAVVVLGTSNAQLQERVTEGCRQAALGRAGAIVLTRLAGPGPYWDTRVAEQVRSLGLRQEVIAVGPVVNTHDEALAVAALARARGWDRVILVTHPTHMRRAAAVFEKAGVHVVCAPCQDARTADGPPYRADDRISLFGDWLYETVGSWTYRRRGWI